MVTAVPVLLAVKKAAVPAPQLAILLSVEVTMEQELSTQTDESDIVWKVATVLAMVVVPVKVVSYCSFEMSP